MRRLIVMASAIIMLMCLYLSAIYGQEIKVAGTQPSTVNISRLIRLIDLDNDHKISKEEYTSFFVKADQDKDGFVTEKEIMELMKRLGQNQEAGNIELGQKAPDFTLKSLDGKKTIKLSDYKGKKPVVLVFGSYT